MKHVTIRDVLEKAVWGDPQGTEGMGEIVQHLKQILEATSDAIWDFNVQRNQVWYSRRWYHMLGYDPDNPPWDKNTNPFLQVIHPDDRNTVLESLEEHIRGRTEVYRARFRLRHRSGRWKWILSRAKTVEWDADGAVMRIVGTHMDISEWQALATENVIAERRHAALLRSVPDMIFLITREGRILDYHATKHELLAAEPEEFLQHNIADVLPQELADASIRLFNAALDEGTTITHEYSLKVGGELHYFEARITPYDQDCVSNIVRDVTERVKTSEKLRQAEERLRHAERLHTIGQLASGIAHDFNNQMNNVLFLGDMLRKRAADPAKVQRYADMMVRRATASSELTTKLLSFARTKAGRPEPIDVHGLLQEVLSLLEYTVGKTIQVHAHLNAESTTVVADRSQLENALLNLGINARDAMPDGGDLTIATDNETLHDGQCPLLGHQHAAGQCIQVTVEDSGVGIPPENIPEIFEPFFTTKTGQMGCGLGLASVADTMRNLRGKITVDSTPGCGSRFQLYIPTEQHEPVKQTQEKKDTPHGRGKLLVVDDEDLFRHVVGEQLQHMGYDVRLASNPEDARKLCADPEQAFDLAIVDIIMPDIDGIELARRLRHYIPALKIILVSGTALNRLDADLKDLHPYRFLGKPVKPETLARTLAELLGEGPVE